MKRNNKFYTLLAAVAMVFTFTSCDDDPWHDWDYYDYSEGWYDDYRWYDDAFNYGTDYLNREASALRGYWKGRTELHYYDNNGQRQVAQMESEFEFDQYNQNSLNGRGREVDYAPRVDNNGNYVYDNTGALVYDSQELRFSWYIDPRTGDINIKYDKSGTVYTAAFQNGFSLDTKTGQFYGTFRCQKYDEELRFDLTRTTLAKPNVDFEEADPSTTAEGQTFGTLATGGFSFSSPMKLHRR